jgi:hypothetical protein
MLQPILELQYVVGFGRVGRRAGTRGFRFFATVERGRGADWWWGYWVLFRRDEVRVVAVGLERERCFAGERRERVSEEAELVVSMKEKEGGRDEGE